jgi:hypothetical protein
MPEEEQARESESGAWMTSGAERTTREGRAWRWFTGRWAEVGRERRGAGAREGGGSRPWAGVGPAERGGEVFLFSFFLFFSLIPFLLYTNIHLYFLGAKMKCYV